MSPTPTNQGLIPGSYTATGTQRSRAGGRDKTFPIALTLTGSGGAISYPSIGCSGQLALVSSDSLGAIFVERIDVGTQCDNGGMWTFVATPGGTIDGSYSPLSDKYTVTAVFHR